MKHHGKKATRVLLSLVIVVLMLFQVIPVYGATQVPPKVVFGHDFSIILKTDGTVWASGANDYGQLGSGNNLQSSVYVAVKDAEGNMLTDIVDISAGYHYACALKSDGTVWTWGDNYYGQLGDGTRNSRNYADIVKVSDGSIFNNVEKIFCGFYCTSTIKTDGSVWGWGHNGYGQLADGTYIGKYYPVQAKDLKGEYLTGIQKLALGAGHCIALKNDGSLLAWGINFSGQLGIGTDDLRLLKAVSIPGMSSVVSISANESYSMAVKSDGTVWSWGANYHGQLGDGTLVDKKVPVQVKDQSGRYIEDVSSVYAGMASSMMLKNDGTVWMSGFIGSDDPNSTSGIVLTANKVMKQDGTELSNVSEISGGLVAFSAITSDNELWSWGLNDYGLLGNGEKSNGYEFLFEFYPLYILNL